MKVGTPLCVPAIGGLHIGKVTSIEANGSQQETAAKGANVAIKIVNEHNPTITYGRQFDSTNQLVSTITRESIDALKENFKDKLGNAEWRLVVKLKKVFNIPHRTTQGTFEKTAPSKTEDSGQDDQGVVW